MTAPRILHLHSTFDLGGKEARAVRLMNAFGQDYRHEIASAVSGATNAFAALEAGVDARLADFPPLAGRPAPSRLYRLSQAMKPYDLVLTYNFGAMDAVLARRLFGGPPIIHHEDGFNQDERERQKPPRILYRRAALPAVHGLVVPSHTLEQAALRVWRQPPARIHRIPNGLDSSRFARKPAADAIPGIAKQPDELWVGTLAGLRSVKNLPRLVQAFAFASRIRGGSEAKLVIVGEGPERPVIEAAAAEAGISAQLVMPGFLPDPSRYVGLFDIFALSSDSEQFPISLIEAMAAGLPAATTDVGDIGMILAEENRPLLARTFDSEALGRSLARLMGDAQLRSRLGAANRERVAREYDEAGMIAAYRSLYEQALAARCR